MLEEVKQYLKITWSSEDSDIQSSIYKGKNYLNELTGVELDFEKEGQPRTLLFDYCRYDYNKSLEYFNENFQKELFRLQLLKAVEDYVAKQAKKDA